MTSTVSTDPAAGLDNQGGSPPVHQVQLVAAADQPNPLRGSPGLVAIPTVIAGAVGLGIINIGALPTGAVPATIAIFMTCTTIGLLLSTVWAAALGLNAAASIYGILLGFYSSYAALILGLTHNWFGTTTPETTTATTVVWLICWLVTILMLTLVTLRMPLAFTVLFGMVDAALVLLIIGVLGGALAFTRAGGVVVFAFVALAVYLYADAMSTATGGKPLPMGRPLLRS